MSKDDFFGDLAALPEPVNREELGKANLGDTEFAPYEEVEEDSMGPSIDDMLSDQIADDLKVGVGEGYPEGEIDFDEIPEADDSDSLHLEDAIDADMIYEVWADIRLGLHTELYDWSIYRNPKQAKKVLRDLGLKDHKTAEEQSLYKRLFDYVNQHDELRSEYRESVPYTDKHRDLFLKYIQKEIEKARLKGKKFPTWLVILYLFVWPEVKAGAKFWKIRQEIPDLKPDFDLSP